MTSLLSLSRGLVLLFCLSPMTAFADLKSASTRGIVGDISNLYLSPNGFEINVMNNDFLGGTDKYFTGGMSFGWLHTLSPDLKDRVFSYEILANWDALTPAQSQTVGGKPLPRTLGRFADWMALRGSVAYSVPNSFGHLKVQLSLGVGHIGNKGMKGLHYSIHKQIGMQTSGLDYTNQPAGPTEDYDFYVGQIKAAGSGELMLGGGISSNKAMKDVYFRANYLRSISTNVAMSAETTWAYQLDSGIYDQISSMRYEVALGFRLYDYFQPSFKFVSSFMKEDPRGQFYAELLRFNIPM